MRRTHEFDVVILGSGISGSILGAILAKQHLKVLLVEAGTHPRFAIGEATTPDTSCRFKLLAMKYGVPELANLATFYKLRDHVSPACGVKRSFSFLYQREGRTQNPSESHQFPTLAPPLGPDCHFFRQDTDAYMLSIALQYGAEVRQQTRITDIDFTKTDVRLCSDKGDTYIAQYLVDASGFQSPLATQFGLRDDPNPLQTNSRAIFTHMVDVKLYDQIAAPRNAYALKYPLSQGTLHHVFAGGWFWIIPFNNHLDAVNPLCSVGLLLNRELYPETGMDPETEFLTFVNRFPDLAKQFQGAKAVRNWVSTGKLQYSSKSMVGDRFCLLAQAAGFVDPLYSSGLNLTAVTIDLLAKRLLKAFQTGDFATAQFQPVDDFFQRALRVYDHYVSSSFLAFQNYDLWDAWFRVWVAGNFAGSAMNTNLYFKYLHTQDRTWLDRTEEVPYAGVLGSHFKEHQELFDAAYAYMESVRQETLDAGEAARKIRDLFKSAQYLPDYYRWHEPEVRTTPAFTFWEGIKLYVWYRLRAPQHVHQQLFHWNPLKVISYVLKSIWQSNAYSKQRKRLYRRDTFKAWNMDWTL